MRRTIAVLTVCGLVLAGAGCRHSHGGHVGGKCDYGADAADAVPQQPTNPYPYPYPYTVAPAGPAAPTAPVPVPGK